MLLHGLCFHMNHLASDKTSSWRYLSSHHKLGDALNNLNLSLRNTSSAVLSTVNNLISFKVYLVLATY